LVWEGKGESDGKGGGEGEVRANLTNWHKREKKKGEAKSYIRINTTKEGGRGKRSQREKP